MMKEYKIVKMKHLLLVLVLNTIIMLLIESC